MLIREATYSDMESIFWLFEQGRNYFRAHQIPQWLDGYPGYDTVFGDIDDGICYVAVEDDAVVATFVCDFSGEPTYDVIYGGAWMLGGEYAALHRVAVSPDCKGQGIGGKIVGFVRSRCEENGVDSIRCDTHRLNLPMQRMLTKNGFVYCGTIRLANGAERVAFQSSAEPDYTG